MAAPETARRLLERALVAEERVEELERQVYRLRRNVSAALDMDPTTAWTPVEVIGDPEAPGVFAAAQPAAARLRKVA